MVKLKILKRKPEIYICRSFFKNKKRIAKFRQTVIIRLKLPQENVFASVPIKITKHLAVSCNIKDIPSQLFASMDILKS